MLRPCSAAMMVAVTVIVMTATVMIVMTGTVVRAPARHLAVTRTMTATVAHVRHLAASVHLRVITIAVATRAVAMTASASHTRVER